MLKTSCCKNIGLLLVIFCCFVSIGRAQKDNEITNQIWLDYYFSYLPKEALQFTGDLGYRKRFSRNKWNQYILRGSVLYSYRSWLRLFGGLGFFFTTKKNITNTLELRPWLGAQFIVGVNLFSYIRFTNLTRIEDRFVIKTQESGTNNALRLRNQTNMEIPVTNHILIDNTFYLKFEIEFFSSSFNISEQSADRIRLGGGFGYKFNYAWRAEFYYYAHRTKNTFEGGREKTDNILRLSVWHYLE